MIGLYYACDAQTARRRQGAHLIQVRDALAAMYAATAVAPSVPMALL